MTICMAGICEHGGTHAIFCVGDSQGTYGDFIKSDDQLKLRPIGRGTLLFADDPSDAAELIALLRKPLLEFDQLEKPPEDFDLRVSNLLAELRSAVRKRKSEIVNHHMSMKYNITFPEFLKEGTKWYPLDTYANMLNEIQHIRLGCEIIYAYAADCEPVLIEITNSGKVRWPEENYLCVGSGSTIALSVLCQEDWYRSTTLMDCVARLLFAKKASEKDPAVGTNVFADILLADSTRHDLTTEFWGQVGNDIPRIKAPSEIIFKDEYLIVVPNRVPVRGKRTQSGTIQAAASEEPSSEE